MSSDQHPTSGCSIMIVDDNAFNREILELFLQGAGWTNLTHVQNGQEALQKIAEIKPDLVLLDLSMPVMDGFEFCEKLRALPGYGDLPVIVQTAMTSLDDRRRAFAVGATDFITKPVFKEELIARTRIHLENRTLVRNLKLFYTRVSAELESARAMQHMLVPPVAHTDMIREQTHIDIASHYMPATELGGDIWGTYILPDGRVAIYCADFSGHGVASAINTFRLHVLLSGLNMIISPNPSAVLEYLNAELQPTLPRGQYLALFYAIIDRAAGTLQYAAASMPDALLLSNGKVERLKGAGLPIGVTRSATYATTETSFKAGDTLLLFSDALVEGRKTDGLLITHDDIAAMLQTTSGKSAKGAVGAALALFSTVADASRDDLTIIAATAQ